MVLGPWTHGWPDSAGVEPWDWLPEAVRWWDRWLRDDHNGIDEQHPVRVFLQGAGAWVETTGLPAPGTDAMTLMLGPGRSLGPAVTEDGNVRYVGDARVGAYGALFDPQATGLGFPLEQAVDNRRAACFTSAPLESNVDVLGPIQATIHVTLEEGAPFDLVAKVCAVDPDGASHLVATGWLNGRHRRGHDRDEPIALGTVEAYTIRLWATGYRFRPGQRIRLAISTSDWPHSFAAGGNQTIAILRWTSPLRTSSCRRTGVAAIIPVQIQRPDLNVNRSPHLIQERPYWTITEDPVNETVLVSFGSAEDFHLPHGPLFHAEFEGKAFVARHRRRRSYNGRGLIDTTVSTGEHIRVETRSHVTRTTMLLNANSWSMEDRASIDIGPTTELRQVATRAVMAGCG